MHIPSRLTTVIVAICSAGLLSACTGDDSPPPEPSPSETAALDLDPVVGEREITSASTSYGAVLGLAESGPLDQAEVDAAAATVGDWLDSHLDSLQHGEGGLLDEIADPGLTGDTSAATTDLTDPDNPVAGARYVMLAQHDGRPDAISVRVEVTRADDSVALAALVFVIDEEGSPRLVLLGPDVPAEDEPTEDETTEGDS